MPAGITSRTVSFDNVNTFTVEHVIPELRDTIYIADEFPKRLDSKKRRIPGGTYIRQPLLYDEGPFAMFDGRSPIDTSEAEKFTSAYFPWRWAAASASIAVADEAMNSGPEAVMDLVQNHYKTMVMTYQSGIAQQIHSAGTGPLEIGGIQGAIGGTGTTYGGISGTTYSWWRSVSQDMTSIPFSDAQVNVFINNMTSGSRRPQAFVCDKTVQGYLYNATEPMKRIVNNDGVGNIGFTGITVHGLPVLMDEHCAASTLYGINFDFLELVVHKDWDMKFIPWDNWESPFMKTCFMVSSLNIVCSNRRFQGKMTALTS